MVQTVRTDEAEFGGYISGSTRFPAIDVVPYFAFIKVLERIGSGRSVGLSSAAHSLESLTETPNVNVNARTGLEA